MIILKMNMTANQNYYLQKLKMPKKILAAIKKCLISVII